MEVPIEELRIGVIGSVDSGKSTLTGVLTKDVLDDGRGFARSKILRYPHEKESGNVSRNHKIIAMSNNNIYVQKYYPDEYETK